MKKTPFHPEYVRLGARMIPFGEWEMPVQFAGILAEHNAVRKNVGLFDISHMGQVWVTGSASFAFLQNLLSNDISRLQTGKGQYTLMCRPDGCIVDDLYVFLMGTDTYLLIINAGRRTEDMTWILDQAGSRAGLRIEEQKTNAGLALQGPRAAAIMDKLVRSDYLAGSVLSLKRNEARGFSVNPLLKPSTENRPSDITPAYIGHETVTTIPDIVVSRTGYTGEDGFEFFGRAEHLLALHDNFHHLDVPLCGLGCRDTLRLEMGYRLYGQDLDERHTALESGLQWVVKLDKGDFIGRDALRREKESGSRRRFIGFRLAKGAGVPRHEHRLVSGGQTVGIVTSGSFSPSLGVGIGMGFVENALFKDNAPLSIRIHDKDVPTEIVVPPFHKPQTVV
ncbi:MAG TPA: glycine cleavage system aminomethyltransferase GcvT [Elusimicrobiota bacterium]|nr:glycine cleavage system aminomethyltransferase GcvT [Elusimicrobiota bacterium]